MSDIALQPTGRETGADRPLLHICAAHPREADPPCSPGCVALCGHVLKLTKEEGREWNDVRPYDCVVCQEMQTARRRRGW